MTGQGSVCGDNSSRRPLLSKPMKPNNELVDDMNEMVVSKQKTRRRPLRKKG